MNGEDDMITVNGIAVETADAASPQLAAIRELLRQRAVALALLAPNADEAAIGAAIERVLDSEVKTPVPGDAECRRYYDAHANGFRSGDLVFARHILFQITPGASLDLVRDEAERTLKQVVAAPEEFEICALTLSNCPSGRQGGNLGQIGRGETVPEFEQALFADAGIGILPYLVKTRYGFHILSIDRRVKGELLPFEVARLRIAELLTARVQETALRQYVRLLAGQAEIKGVALDAAPTPLVQ